ncbi:MAG: 4-phosphopantetheinyl transferase [Methylomonas sp.]|nr:MAG: 4-phosphopantetheinyl transferase [Methylobacter sp.]PPD32440.1 MAG: 4-phosphopantetheinyl transferase [Methylomonas sp.]
MSTEFNLPPHTVDLWRGTVSHEAQHPLFDAWLSPDERRRMLRFKFPALQTRFLHIRGSLRQIMAGYVNEPPERLRFAYSEFGKPYLADYPALAFNLSHTGDDWIIAVGCCPLGVDLEHCKPRDSLPELVARFFAGQEAAFWQALPESRRLSAFYQLWTCKEAFLKATGRGIAAGLQDCVLDTDSFQRFLQVPKAYQPASQWQLLTQHSGLVHCVALVCQSSEPQTVRHKSIRRLELPTV